MVLLFPSHEILRQALAAGIIPVEMARSSATAASDDQGQLWIEPAQPFSKSTLSRLQDLGVRVQSHLPERAQNAAPCWHALMPLLRMPTLHKSDDTVLFECPEVELCRLIAELTRLGKRHHDFQWTVTGRVLVRVTAPPGYSLEQAREHGDGCRIAYSERKPGVWIELDHQHPLLAQIEAPPGRMVLLNARGDWTFIDADGFIKALPRHDFELSAQLVGWHDVPGGERIPTPLRLARAAFAELAQLWVLEEHGVDQLHYLACHHDDALLARLSVAVARIEDREIVVMRLRPSRQPPPVLVVNGIGFQPYLKLPNLFVPCGSRLHPLPRRDVLRTTLASDPGRIFWLFPGPNGRFTPQSIAESAFQPLQDWIEYRQNGPRMLLNEWQPVDAFGLEAFTVHDDEPLERKPVAAEQSRPRAQPLTKAQVHEAGREPVTEAEPEAPAAPPDTSEVSEGAEAVPRMSLSDLQRHLGELEKSYLDSDAPLDAPQRQELWRAMAEAHTALEHHSDATLCWTHALWEEPAGSAASAQAWLRAETGGRPLLAADLDRCLSAATPIDKELRALAAHVHAAAHVQPHPDAFRARLGAIQQLLEKQEGTLPIRVAWLAHVALYNLAQRDVLALTRARDRLLERLFQHGLRPELDLPSFLRIAGRMSSDRFHLVRDHLLRLHRLAHAWLRKHPRAALTPAYADLTFAFGLARLGEPLHCDKLLQNARKKLAGQDELHAWLQEAYTLRIHQALRGEPTSTALPAELRERVNTLPRDLPYKCDRLRQLSRLLEPHEGVDAQARFHQHHDDSIGRELALLSFTSDRTALRERLQALLDAPSRQHRANRGVIIGKGLELAPRLGGDFAQRLLERIMPALADLDDSLQAQAVIIEKGIQLAAHFDQAAMVTSLVNRFLTLVSAGAGNALGDLEPILEQSFRGLRKFGMRDIIGTLLQRMTEALLAGRDLHQARLELAAQATGGMLKERLSAWKSLLHVAAGWLYVSQEELALPILDETRALLLQKVLHPLEQTSLASAYAAALGQASAELALPRYLELFRKLERVNAVLTTDSHLSMPQLGVVEAVVLALVSDDFALDARGRRWLEDDEYHVRRRIHCDVRGALQEAGLT